MDKYTGFDWKYYLEIYPDLVKNGINTYKKAKYHYAKYGNKEMRVSKKFDFYMFRSTKYRFREKSGMNKINIIVSSLDYPSYGGAATNAYQIIKFMRSNNINCAGLFFNNDTDVSYDPENLGGIFISPLLHIISKNEITSLRTKIIEFLYGEPTHCFGKNFVSPLYCKVLFPVSYIIYLVSGINHFDQYYAKRGLSALDVLSSNFVINENNPLEQECIDNVNLIIFNSKLTEKLFRKIYPDSNTKLYPFVINTTYLSVHNEICRSPKTFKLDTETKKYDIIVCCSNLDRIDKNNGFSLEILKENFHYCKKLIVGRNYKKFVSVPNSKCVGLVTRTKCLEYLKQSKILLYPSLFDSNPSTVIEAISRDCIPVISKNIGNYKKCSNYMICNSFNKTEWIQKIKTTLKFIST